MPPLPRQWGQRALRALPNAMTSIRLLVSPLLLGLILAQEYGWALALAALAGASDALDGLIAKSFRCQSRYGEVMDPLADKAMLWAAYIGLATVALAPLWLLLLVVARDVVILSGAIAFRLRVGKLPIAPNIASKINTFFQIIAALWLLMVGAFAHAWASWVWVGGVLVGIVAVTALVSGAEYVLGWSRIYVAQALAPRPSMAPVVAGRGAAGGALGQR